MVFSSQFDAATGAHQAVEITVAAAAAAKTCRPRKRRRGANARTLTGSSPTPVHRAEKRSTPEPHRHHFNTGFPPRQGVDHSFSAGKLIGNAGKLGIALLVSKKVIRANTWLRTRRRGGGEGWPWKRADWTRSVVFSES